MASADLVRLPDDNDPDVGLSDRQIAALEKLAELGAEPAPIDPETGKGIYSKDPKIRAFQLLFEGRFGGPGRGQGRPREPRAAEAIAEAFREEPRVKKMISALDRALTKKAGTRANLDAIKLVKDIEQDERRTQLKEAEQEDNLGGDKEELIATIFELVQRPSVANAIDAEHEEITDADIISDNEEDELDRSGEEEAPVYNFQKRRTPPAATNGSNGDSPSPATNGHHSRKPRSNDRGRSSSDSGKAERTFDKVARRRAGKR